MKLIKYHDAHTRKRPVAVDHAGKDAFGYHLDAGLLRNACLETDPVPHGLAYLLAQQLRQAFGNCFGCQAPWLQHNDLLARKPGLVHNCQRQQGAFTGSGRGVYDQRVLYRQVLPNGRYNFPNGKVYGKWVEGQGNRL
jgi:hypothetical protein